MQKIQLFFILFIISLPSLASLDNSESISNNSFCQDIQVGIKNKLNWSKSFYLSKFNKDSKRENTTRFKYTHFDIDNDGNLEVLVIDYIWFSNDLGEAIFIFETEEEFEKSFNQQIILNKDIFQLKGLKSRHPWPYSNLGVYLPLVKFITYKDHNYILLKDKNHGAQVVVEYTGESFTPLNENYTTIKLNLVCKI